MPFELIVALRYLREGRTQTALILAGIAVGVGVIVFLSALIGGLQRTLVATTLGVQAHIVVRPREEVPRVLGARDDVVREVRLDRPAQRVRSIVQWQQVRSTVDGMPGVLATSPTITGAAIVMRGGGADAVSLHGIEPATYRRIVPLDSLLVAGRMDLDGLKVLIGVDLARELGVKVGGRVRLRVGAEDRRGGVDTASTLTAYTVSGIFDFGNAELNGRWVFASLRTTQSLLGLEGGASGIEVRVREIFTADRIAAEVARRTGLVADSWMTTNAQLLRGLRSQSASSAMIQVFVVLAVALGIASVLAVSVVQKSREIGILRATGTSRRQILRIFLTQGAILGGVGSVIGIAIGIGLGTFFASLARNPDGSPTFPVDLDLALYLRSAAIAIGVGTIAALLPARRAARMNPADAIRTG
ncbi:MAG TPA: FtsX-like permease family protein [Gemmatimonadaceae bacterium]|nr:FtsX-like permease family protein [Gemmatimonadaceae bacterium]